MGASNKQVIVGSVVVVALAISIAYMSITKPVDKEAITEEVPEVFVFNETVSSFEQDLSTQINKMLSSKANYDYGNDDVDLDVESSSNRFQFLLHVRLFIPRPYNVMVLVI